MDLAGNVTIWNISDFKVEKTFTAKDINHSEGKGLHNEF